MRKILLFITMTFALLFTGCKKDKGVNLSDILVGQWTLEEYIPATKGTMIGSEPVDVTLYFSENHTFKLYQRVGEGYTESFDGTWSLEGSKLTGIYSDGKPWGEQYDVTFKDGNNTLEMKTSKAGETYIYQRDIAKE